MLNMIYGEALVDAYKKAEAMSWAGCILDKSAINYAKTLGNIDPLLDEYTMNFEVPYKTKEGEEIKLPEYAIRLSKGPLLETRFVEDGIRNAFTEGNKGNIEGRVKVIFDNTINFLRAHQVRYPFYYKKIDSSEEGYNVYGKLEENYTHTIITVPGDKQNGSGRVETTQFDLGRDDRGFLDQQLATEEEFEFQMNNVSQ